MSDAPSAPCACGADQPGSVRYTRPAVVPTFDLNADVRRTFLAVTFSRCADVEKVSAPSPSRVWAGSGKPAPAAATAASYKLAAFLAEHLW